MPWAPTSPCLTRSSPPLTLSTPGKKTVMFLRLEACSMWEEASGRGFDVWMTDPHVTLLGGTWSDRFEAENLPGHTGNGCRWAWLSSLFIFLKKKKKKPYWRVWVFVLGFFVGFFLFCFWFCANHTFSCVCVCTYVCARAFVYSFFMLLVTAGQGCNLVMQIVS